MDRITIITANLGGHGTQPSREERLDYLAALIKRYNPNVIAMQDTGSLNKSPHRHYRLYDNPKSVGETCPFLVHASERVDFWSTVLGSPGDRVSWPDKWVSEIGLKGFGVIGNVHVHAGIERRGRPRRAGARRLRAAYSYIGLSWAALPDVIAGDFNVHARADNRVKFSKFPTAQYRKADLRDAWLSVNRRKKRRGTLGFRVVDRVFHKGEWRVVDYAVAPKREGFNHRAVMVTLERRQH